ncbi:DUF305 domain-containing protein [Nocardioides sp. GY 10113]|nr:DUF305 domain-containing protein [Nocardioides sp. GY 10113]
MAALLLGLTLVVSGCSDDGEDGSGGSGAGTSATDHNQADVDFATAMIPHHAQALVMVDMLRARTDDPQLQQLGIDIREAQAPEIEQMVDWLSEWGEEIPETMRDHVNGGHGMGDLDDPDGMGHMGDAMEGLDDDMPGMMDADDFETLEQSLVFEDMWLTMMIDHHLGAIEMAQDEQADGLYRPAVRLAARIEKSQAEEIKLMRTMLGS